MKKLIAACLMVMPACALAQTAVVRSGDHPSFTRVTVPMPRGTQWALYQTGQNVTLRFDGRLQSLDTRRVFDRISRDRIAEVTTGPGPELRMDLACDCTAEAMTTRSNLLVVDVKDIPFRPVSAPQVLWPAFGAGLSFGQTVETTRPEVSEPATPVARRPEPAPMTGVAGSMLDPLPTPLIELPIVPQRPTAPSPEIRKYAEEVVNALPGATALPETEQPDTEVTRELEKRLLQAIGLAATQGLLDPDPKQQELLPEDLRNMSPEGGDAPYSEPGLSAVPGTLAAENADDPSRFILSNDPCRLHVPTFEVGEEEALPFSVKLGMLRASLTGELDAENRDAYRDLALFYLESGFGAEARQAIEALPQQPVLASEVEAIAAIYDNGFAPAGGPFARDLECDNQASVWAALTGEQIKPGADFNAEAIKRNLLIMPPHLKSYLGAMLAERFGAVGETAYAKDLLRIIDRGEADSSPVRDLAAAQIETEENGRANPETYREIIAKNDEVAPEALLQFANRTLSDGGPVDAETIGLLESYRTQFREGPLHQQLAATEILALASSGNHPAAYDLFGEQFEELRPEDTKGISDYLARGLVQDASDTAFTQLYFQHQDLIGHGARPATLNKIGERLLNLGLLSEASKVIAPGAEGEDGRARRLLRARIALANNLPRGAEEELSGLEGPDVDALRARASLMMQDFNSAKVLFDAAGQSEKAGNAAWLARDWQSLKADETSPASTLAGVVTEQAADPITLSAAGPPTLATSRDVLSQSEETRNALRGLLSSMQVDTALDQ